MTQQQYEYLRLRDGCPPLAIVSHSRVNYLSATAGQDYIDIITFNQPMGPVSESALPEWTFDGISYSGYTLGTNTITLQNVIPVTGGSDGYIEVIVAAVCDPLNTLLVSYSIIAT
jgi:hypothetical protein